MNNGSLLSLNLLDQGILLHCLPVQQGALSEERTRRIDEIFQLTVVMDRAQSKLLDAVLLKYEQSH